MVRSQKVNIFILVTETYLHHHLNYSKYMSALKPIRIGRMVSWTGFQTFLQVTHHLYPCQHILHESKNNNLYITILQLADAYNPDNLKFFICNITMTFLTYTHKSISITICYYEYGLFARILTERLGCGNSLQERYERYAEQGSTKCASHIFKVASFIVWDCTEWRKSKWW